MQINRGGAWRAIQSGQIRKSGSWRSIVQIKMYVSGAWREVGNFTQPPASGGGGGGGTGGSGTTGGGSITTTLSTSTLTKSASNSSTLTTSAVTLTPTGGLAPYAYLWTVTVNDGEAGYTINSRTSASTTVTAAGVALDNSATCSIRCIVTDSLGTTATSGTVVCTFYNNSTS